MLDGPVYRGTLQYVSLRAYNSDQQGPEVRRTVCICIEPGTTTLIAAPRALGTFEGKWSPEKNQRVGGVEVSFHRFRREALSGSLVDGENLYNRFQDRPRLSGLKFHTADSGFFVSVWGPQTKLSKTCPKTKNVFHRIARHIFV